MRRDGDRWWHLWMVVLLLALSACVSPETRQKILTNAEAITSAEQQLAALAGNTDPVAIGLRTELAEKLLALKTERAALEEQAQAERANSGREAGATTIEIVGWILGALAGTTGAGAVAYKIGPGLAAKVAEAIRSRMTPLPPEPPKQA